MSNAATYIKEQARRIAALEIQASSWKRLSEEWKVQHDMLVNRTKTLEAAITRALEWHRRRGNDPLPILVENELRAALENK